MLNDAYSRADKPEAGGLRRVHIRGGARQIMHSEGTFETTADWVPATTWLGLYVAVQTLPMPS